MNPYKLFEKRVRIEGKLVFKTAFHIGSGREGELATDMGVLREPNTGLPLLPGSTLKGNFRTLCERLAPYLGMTACLLDSSLSGVKCAGDENFRRRAEQEFKDTVEQKARQEDRKVTEKERLDWMEPRTCDVCRLFGSPWQASRIFFCDGKLEEGGHGLQVRDGVCIDRDSETARHGLKYDFEVVPEGAEFSFTIDIENPKEPEELALVAAALVEWETGFRLGGFTSRGLGKVKLKGPPAVSSLDYSDSEQLRSYLMSKTLRPAPQLLGGCLEEALGQGGEHA